MGNNKILWSNLDKLKKQPLTFGCFKPGVLLRKGNALTLCSNINIICVTWPKAARPRYSQLKKTMRKIKYLILFFIPVLGFGQNMIIKIYLKDNLNRMDSVIIGKNDSSTTGIDLICNEVNLYGLPYDSIEIRSIQRDSAHHECLSNSRVNNQGSPLYFDNNLDLKNDFRGTYPFSSEDNCFEITFQAKEYPIELIFDFSKSPPFFSHIYWGALFDKNCNLIMPLPIPHGLFIDTLRITSDTTINKIIFKKDHEISILENKIEPKIEFFPNPLTDVSFFRVNNYPLDNAQIAIFDIQGNLVALKKFKNSNIVKIKKEELRNGIYFYRFITSDGKCEVGKIVTK